MALLAIRPQGSPVNVRVAVGTFVTHIGENQFGMALRAGNRLMHAAQRITGLVVIELRNAANRRPTIYGVAILAGNREGAVRAARTVVGLGLRRDRGRQHQPKNNLDQECRSQLAPQAIFTRGLTDKGAQLPFARAICGPFTRVNVLPRGTSYRGTISGMLGRPFLKALMLPLG